MTSADAVERELCIAFAIFFLVGAAFSSRVMRALWVNKIRCPHCKKVIRSHDEAAHGADKWGPLLLSLGHDLSTCPFCKKWYKPRNFMFVLFAPLFLFAVMAKAIVPSLWLRPALYLFYSIVVCFVRIRLNPLKKVAGG